MSGHPGATLPVSESANLVTVLVTHHLQNQQWVGVEEVIFHLVLYLISSSQSIYRIITKLVSSIVLMASLSQTLEIRVIISALILTSTLSDVKIWVSTGAVELSLLGIGWHFLLLSRDSQVWAENHLQRQRGAAIPFPLLLQSILRTCSKQENV